MKTLFKTISELKDQYANNPWGERLVAEMAYAYRVLLCKKGDLEPLEKALSVLAAHEGPVNEAFVKHCEELMQPMAEDCKSYSLLLASHSHIDLNFLWGYDETVSVVINTFSTMLNLLDEYPDFVYSQSSALAYEIVEKYAPELLEKIKNYVHQGRWELLASSWVESDKNMPGTESLVMQSFYAKTYLSKLFDVAPESLKVGFEPDTFGHSKNLPEILQHCGVDYYYFCRGEINTKPIFLWEADSGKKVLAYKEPHWYDSRIQADMVMTVPEFCDANHVNTMMKVYGVGDHGGGPTRRDLERALDMMNWPLFPKLYFGTYHAYFELLSQQSHHFPLVHNEINPIFTGCYTSQSRIKAAHKNAESMLFQAELFNTLSSRFAADHLRQSLLDEAWKKTLSNQFHDILPGSCTPEVKDYALGLFQQAMAASNTVRALSLEALAKAIDTSGFWKDCEPEAYNFSFGAGAGMFVEKLHSTGIPEKSVSKNRVFHVFNPSQFAREEVAEVLLWDYNENIDTLVIYDSKGNLVPHQVIKKAFSEEWGHFYIRLYVFCQVGAFGYNSYLLTQKQNYGLDEIDKIALDYKLVLENLPPKEEQRPYVLENKKVKASFDPRHFRLSSFINKDTGMEFCKEETGIFTLLEEDANTGGNAWVVGRLMKENEIKEFNLLQYQTGGLHQYLQLRASFGRSELELKIALNEGDSNLVYSVNCTFLETPSDRIPQLAYTLSHAYPADGYLYDIPAGTIKRRQAALDFCGNSFVIADRAEESSRLMLTASTNYGYRCEKNSISLKLLRASKGPDKYPELGQRSFHFAVCLIDNLQSAYQAAHSLAMPLIPLSTSPAKDARTLPPEHSFLSLDCDNLIITSVKPNGIIRILETQGRDTEATLRIGNQSLWIQIKAFELRTISIGD